MKERKLYAVLLLLPLLVCACGSDSEKLTKEIKEAVSWTASARAVAESYSSGAVPRPYAARAIESFGQEIQSTSERLQSLSESDNRRAQALATVQHARQTIAQIRKSIDERDDLSLAQLNLQLDNDQKTLTSLAGTTVPSHP